VQVSPPEGSLTAGQQRAITAALDRQPGTAHYVAETDDQLSGPGQPTPVTVTAYAGAPRWIGWTLITGRWYTGNGQADVNTAFLTDTGTAVGGTYTLTSGGRQTAVRIAGEVFDPHGNTADAFMSAATLAAALPGLAPDQYDVGIRPGTTAQSYANALSAALGPSYDITTSTSSPSLKAVVLLTIVLTILLIVVAGLGVLNTVVLQIRDRAHDLGVFKAIGMTPAQTLAMVICSVCGIGILAGLIATPAGVALHQYVVPVMGHAGQTNIPAALLSVYPPAELALLALSGLLIAAVAALGPAGWASRVRTATALRAE
jgi:putative ABC transport system permease protein